MKPSFFAREKELNAVLLSLVFFVPCIVLQNQGNLIPAAVFGCLSVGMAGFRVFVAAVKGILRHDLLDEKFLMCIACLGAIALGDFKESAAVMIFFQIGEYFQNKAVKKSRASIQSLMSICPDEACVLRDGTEQVVDAEDVQIGELLLLRTGERVALDCVITEGVADVDTSALTGESLPRSVGIGNALESGTVISSGVLRAKVLHTADTSAAARILEMVETATENKSKEELFITKFARVYTPFVVGCALVLGLIVPLFCQFDFRTYIERALTFLVISCPCALVISVPMAFFGGIGGAAKHGILFKGGNVFSAVANVGTVAFDKTGTLTTGCFSVQDVLPVGWKKDELLSLAAMAEYGSNHPLALCLKQTVTDVPRPTSSEEKSGMGMLAQGNGHRVAVGNQKLMLSQGIPASVLPSIDASSGVLYVAIDGEYAGAVLIGDTVKEHTAAALSSLKKQGVKKTVMLSGDKKEIATAVGNVVGIDEVYAELLPEEKYQKLTSLMQGRNAPVMYVGDGINDAPSLACADVGVAMGGIGQDSAIEAADIVLMSDAPEKLPVAISVARKTLRVSKENIIFALGVKAAVMVFGALGLLGSFAMLFAVFADVGVAVLDIVNAMRTLYIRES